MQKFINVCNRPSQSDHPQDDRQESPVFDERFSKQIWNTQEEHSSEAVGPGGILDPLGWPETMSDYQATHAEVIGVIPRKRP